MGKYRFKPVATEAVQFDGNNWVELAVFCGTRTVDGHTIPIFNPIGTYLPVFQYARPDHKAELYIEEQGKHAMVKIGDWIVKRKDGDFWLCDNSIFQRLFEQTGE